MIAEGQIILFRFPQTDQQIGKLRPALIIRKLPGQYNDWLICMVSSQLDQEITGFDEVMTPKDSDFRDSGLKQPSLIRICRLAVVSGQILIGKIGRVDSRRLSRIKQNLSQWIQATDTRK
jgi:mRNA interferase MazF